MDIKIVLKGVSASVASVQFELSEGEYIVGRSADRPLDRFLDLEPYDGEAKVSRQHAKLYVSSDTVSVEDLGSLNGTYLVSGEQILPGKLRTVAKGDELVFGNLVFKVSY